MIYTDELARLAREQNGVHLSTTYRWRAKGEIPDHQLLTIRTGPVRPDQQRDMDLLLLLIDLGYIQGWSLAKMMGREKNIFFYTARSRRDPIKWGMTHPLRSGDVEFITQQILNPLRTLATHLSSRVADAGDGLLPDQDTLNLVRYLLGHKGVRMKRLCNGFSRPDYMRMRHLCLYGAIWNIFDKPLLTRLGQHLATIPFATDEIQS